MNFIEFFQKKYLNKGYNQNYEFATQILQKVQQIYKASTISKRMSKMALLKYISSIYADKLKNLQQNTNPLYIIAYEVFLQKYGLKSVSENKYNQVSLNIISNFNGLFEFRSFWKPR